MTWIIDAVTEEVADVKRRYHIRNVIDLADIPADVDNEYVKLFLESEVIRIMPEQILWIKDEDANELIWADRGPAVECETSDGSLAILTHVASELNPEHRRWEIVYEMVVRDQEDRLWIRGYSTPATEQQEGQDRWTYDTEPRGDSKHSAPYWVGFRPCKAVEVTTIDYIGLKEHL